MLDSPYSEDAEKSVLGALLVDGLRAMDECQRLQPEHFYLPSHQEIFGAFRSQLADHPVIDLLAIQNASGNRINAVGRIAYIMDLSAGIFRGFDITQRVDTILEKWKLRRGMEICDQYGARFRDGGASAEILAALQSEVVDAIQETTEQDDPLVAAYSDAAFDDLMQKVSSPNATGLSYGVSSLDTWTDGMQSGQVTIVGARSGVGKSALRATPLSVIAWTGWHATSTTFAGSF